MYVPVMIRTGCLSKEGISRKFKTAGRLPLTIYLKNYKVGDIVDIKGDGAVQKGMPHKSYHGKTGRVYNVSRRAVGVTINKQVRGRIFKKQINVRVEHVKHSTCREDFLRRVSENDAKKAEANAKGEKIFLKRQAVQPRAGRFVRTKKNIPTHVQPLKFEFTA